jgi:hypothetical protein
MEAFGFGHILDVVHGMVVNASLGTDDKAPLHEGVRENLIAGFGALLKESRKLGLIIVPQKIESALEMLSRENRTHLTGAASRATNDVISTIYMETKAKLFFAMSLPDTELYDQKEPIFGELVERKFPEASEDISEAGKCLALDRSTAAVFHMMRVMEIGTQKFGRKLGVKLATEKNWQNIIDELNKAIKALDPKAPETRAYAEASAHLFNVKLCWRNPVMHPKQTYGTDEARAIFAAVKNFMSDLAGVL